MQVLVTGVNGFVGRHLVRELADHGAKVVGAAREVEPHADISGTLVDYVVADLAAGPLAAPPADGIVHLAALSAVGPSFADPAGYLSRNTAMLVNVCEPLLAAGASPRVLVVSTGAVYDSQQPMPIPESGAIAPTSPYVVSKLATEELARYYDRRGLPAVVVRPFNHIGPGQGPGFLLPDMARSVRAAAAEGRAIRVGNLASARDFTDVRDVVRAYRLLLEADLPADRSAHTVNVCSGTATTGEQILAEVLRQLSLDSVGVEVDPARIRPNDPPVIQGDATRLRELTGWTPRIPLAATIADVLAEASAA